MYRMLLLIAIILAALAQPSITQAASIAILRSDPADGAVIDYAPTQIRVWMNATALIDPLSVQLSDTSNTTYPLQARTEVYQPIAAGLADRFDSAYLSRCALRETTLPTLLLIDLPPLPKGTYQIVWQISNGAGRKAQEQSLVFAVQAESTNASLPATPSPAIGHLQAADLVGSLMIRPNLPGQNFVSFDLSSSRRPAPPIDQVMLHLTPPDGSATRMIQVPADDHGQYLVAGDWLDQPGNWQIDVVVERRGGEQLHIPVRWSVGTPASQFGQPTALLPWGIVIGCAAAIGLWLPWRRRLHAA
jgi:methionine-rich copper-binding protein CopC